MSETAMVRGTVEENRRRSGIFERNRGKHSLIASFSGFDPTERSILIASEAKLGHFFLTDHSQRC